MEYKTLITKKSYGKYLFYFLVISLKNEKFSNVYCCRYNSPLNGLLRALQTVLILN